MNPQFDQTPGLHLPQPNAGGPQTGYNPVPFNAPQVATPLSQPQTAPAPNPQPATQVNQPAYSPAPDYSSQSSSTPMNHASASASDDADGAGDEEWVNKARDIATRYKGDPYMQSKELSRLKAQYVKARYNKDIKVSEDRS